MPRIVATSDTHMGQPDVPAGDIFIHCGDLTHTGTIPQLTRAFAWIASLPHKHKLIVPGNHDFGLQQSPRLFDGPWTLLVDQLVEIEGLRIYGSPWTPTFQRWAFMKSETELAEVFARIPSGLDVLVTHGPPFGILDSNVFEHVCGSRALLWAVGRAKPAVHIFGHIHEDGGQHNVTQHTTFYNVAYEALDKNGPKPPNQPKVIYVPTRGTAVPTSGISP